MTRALAARLSAAALLSGAAALCGCGGGGANESA
jgi:hypothetical protein